jgi:hypothetical protein
MIGVVSVEEKQLKTVNIISMKTVYKFKLSNEVELPKDAEVLKIAIQHGIPMMWVLLNLDEEIKVQRHFHKFGTGHNIPDELVYIDTYTEGVFVWHIFESIN